MTQDALHALLPLIRTEVRRQLLLKSYFDFFVFFWDCVVQDPLVLNWHVEYLCNECQKIGEKVIKREPKEHDLIINIPPGESKSTIVTILFPVWLWCRDASLRIISGSYAQTLSTDHAVKSRNVIRSDKFQKYFGHLFTMSKDQDNKSKYLNDKTGERNAVSTGSAVTGSHAHLIIIDDPLNAIQAQSETELIKCNTWIRETLSTRKVDKAMTPTILVMQRLHEDDATSEFAKRNKVKHIVIPGELTEDVKPSSLKQLYKDGIMNTKRSSRSVLDGLRVDLGSRGYAGQILQRPAPTEGNILKKEWFQKYNKHDVLLNTVHFYIDTAYTSKGENDPSGVLAFSKVGNDLYLINFTKKRFEFPELCKFIPGHVELHGYSRKSKIYVEPKASGKSVVQQLKRSTSLSIIEDTPPKESKVVRCNAISPIVEAGRVFVPVGESWVDEFLNQCAMFPNAKHDEEIDTLVGAINKILNYKKGISKFVKS